MDKYHKINSYFVIASPPSAVHIYFIQFILFYNISLLRGKSHFNKNPRGKIKENNSG